MKMRLFLNPNKRTNKIFTLEGKDFFVMEATGFDKYFMNNLV